MITYTVALAQPRQHRFFVTLALEAHDEEIVFSMPAWIPGSYLLRDYARHVAAIRGRCDGAAVPITKLDAATWSCAGSGALEVEMEIFGFDLSVRSAYLDDRRAFFNGTCLFPWVHGKTAQPQRLIIETPQPSYCQDWRVATAMSPVAVDKKGFGTYEAADYDELIDHPVEIGVFEREDFTAAGVPHHVVITGRHEGDLNRLTTDLIQLCETQIDHFGRPAPMAQYWFLGLATAEGYGGLEHRASSSLIFSRDELPRVGEPGVSKKYRRLLGLFSHEYFHSWLIKRIKPAAFTPYELQRRNYTELLWLFEGFTTYYQNLMLLRAGLLGVTAYLELLADTLNRVYRAPGRLAQSASESSFDAWDKLYKPTPDSANLGISYYSKGAMAALGLDLNIRLTTDGQFSLDTVLLKLWKQFGGPNSSGLPEHGFEAVLREATGEDFGLLLNELTNQRSDPPLADWLALFGVAMSFERRNGFGGEGGPTAAPAVELGLRLAMDQGLVRVRQVLAGTTAEAAGAAPGDELVAIDGLRLRGVDVSGMLGRAEPGDPIRLTLTRGDELLEREAVLQGPQFNDCSLTLVENTDQASLERRTDWLGADLVT
jgi:predicted metalloprotease with PDZ domain